MKLFLSIFGITLPSLLFFSCQKEIASDILLGTVKNDSTVLSKYIELDTAFPSGQDTTSIYTFSYDNLKRIKQITQVKKFPGQPSTTVYNITTEFFYSGNERLPYKTIELNQEGVTYVDTSFYTYSNGLVRSDSSVNYRVDNNELLFTNTVSFSVSGSSVFVKLKEINGTSIYSDSATLTITRQNGNIISQYDPQNAITDNIQLKCDNKVNPLYNADIHYPIIYEHLFNSFNAQKNNITEDTRFTRLVNPKQHLQYSYSYRPDGYPLTVKKDDLLNLTASRKGLFFYTK
ncbi:MAG TPA: hypothetical protein VGQ09_18635 [Chitinophagaceae bacterium]|jgi:hypothetical protein|nr:hypothetical protein [Chitinophagaceae bacterium]